MVVTVFDGLASSNPGTLTIDVSDVDESPVMSQTGYVINTEEVSVSNVDGGNIAIYILVGW